MMKKTSLFLVIIAGVAFMSSCGNNASKKAENKTDTTATNGAEASPVKIAFEKLGNYFVKNTVPLDADVNLLVAKDAESFNKQFGVGKTMSNKVKIPNFADNMVLAIACKPTDEATTINLESVVTDKSGIVVNVSIAKGEPQSFKSTPMVLISIPKQADGSMVKVVEGGNTLVIGTL